MKLIPLLIVVLSSVFLGCVQPPAGTPIPTAAVTVPPAPAQTATMPTPALTHEKRIPIRYRIWVDSDLGFYRVRAIKGNSSFNLPSDFDIMNFTVNAGDSVRWINDDSYDFPLTIVSSEGLWTGRTGLTRYQGERFEYTFNRTGTYMFSIKEYPRIKNQTISVNP